MEWSLDPEEVIRRVDLHRRYGGNTQSGIAPLRNSPNILIFSDPRAGEEHGYHDRWESAEILHYCGEGQVGDQEFVRGNKAILEYAERGRALRVFRGARGEVRYLGEFELDEAQPFYWADAPQSSSAATRKVIMFRLRRRA